MTLYNIIDNSECLGEILKPTGKTTSSEDGRVWLEHEQTSVLTEKLLSGNIAFADNCDRYFLRDKIVCMKTSCIMDRDNRMFYIPKDVVKDCFGLAYNEEYVSSEEIKDKCKLYTFFDPRGFIMFSEKENAVDTNDYDSIFKSYHDSFSVIAAIGTLHWNNVSLNKQDYAKYRENWYNALVNIPEKYKSRCDIEIQNEINLCATYKSKLSIKNADKGPFIDIYLDDSDTDDKANVIEVLRRLNIMAFVWIYNEKKDNELRNGILKSLDYLYNSYQKKIPLIDGTPGWPCYTFDCPHLYANLLLMMYDELSIDDIKKHTNAIFDRVPDPTITRGVNVSKTIDPLTFINRLWTTQGFINAAILAEDEQRINYGMRYINEAFEPSYRNICDYLVLSPDGFYPDGSMIFHGMIGYNTGYGRSYAIMITNYLLLSENTKIDIRNVYNFKNVYSFAENGLIQFTADNILLKMTTGRHFPNEAYKLITNVIPIINRSSNRRNASIKLYNEIKTDIETYKTCIGLGGWSAAYFARLEEVDKFLDYIDDIPDKGITKSCTSIYNSMNKAMHIGENFKFCISMSSSRINKFEYFGGEDGKKDWYMNDGAVFLYIGDKKHLDRNWLEKFNPYYVPGTTVDSTSRKPTMTIDWKNARSSNDWAGGVTDGNCGIVSMILGNLIVSGLDGKKSYFMYKDKVVCLGTGIKGGNGNVYTTVDNRIVDDGDIVTINGKNHVINDDCIYTDISSIDIGNHLNYTFINPCTVRICKERSNGCEFLRISIEHGQEPCNAQYSYLYSINNNVINYDIIEQSNKKHEIKFSDLVMASVFEPSYVNEFNILTACCIMIKNNIIFCCDPTAKKDYIELEVPDKYKIQEQNNVYVNGNIVRISIKNDRSAIYKVKYVLKEGWHFDEKENNT